MPELRFSGYKVFLFFIILPFLKGCDSDQPVKKAAQQVSVMTMTPETIETNLVLAGRTVASEVSQVRPQVNGVVIAQLFQEGSYVKKGQPLYKIDSTLYRDSFEEARGNLELAQATVNSTRLQAERYEQLISVNGVSRQELDDARAAYAQAKAAVNVNQALLKTAQTNLNYTQITAPISGQIGRSAITRGALVTSSQVDALVTIQNLDPMYVDLTQSSDEYIALRNQLTEDGVEPEELTVSLELNNGKNYRERGTFKFSDITVDQATGSVTLRVSFANPNQNLLPGMYVRARLGTGPRSKSLLIPQGIEIRNADGEAFVWVIGQGNKVEQRAITLGEAIENRWLVLSGLRSGDKVVVEGLQGLNAGMTVEPTPIR
ncbi:efflux RND transporter periplasmic adaptor subunit [Acinetobacter haemolyticus]|uniref:efflux RND transporter periplasmic adaptor subunit n=1 Tax=Acinetobacter haemolyticus TaxID=29430 RepID=UPI002A6A0B24|nr:efflux RND transporter periplasmic adaptor subunit [Acinetobacter haemolyticus]WPO65956.1 efflux RND transporter periplasmic adaptor subunit [Acinetobacter haemolyticus]